MRDYRAAIALNNAGVNLLEKRAYKQAMETLQDGIHVMKEAFRRPQGASPQDMLQTSLRPVSSAEIDFKLRRASHHIAHPQPMHIPMPFHAVVDGQGKQDGVDLKALSFDVTGISSSAHRVLDFLGESPSTTCFLPIRIDLPSDSYFSQDSFDRMVGCLRDADAESAVMLYNFGVANLLLSKAVAAACESSVPGRINREAMGTALTGDNVAEKLRANAISILNLASGVLSKKSAGGCEDTVEETVLLQLGLLVFHTIIQVLVEGGNDMEAQIVYDRYVLLRQAVAAIQESEWFYNSEGLTKISAPAA